MFSGVVEFQGGVVILWGERYEVLERSQFQKKPELQGLSKYVDRRTCSMGLGTCSQNIRC